MRRQGFTLIELLVVISIIGVLITSAVTSYINAQKKSRDARRRNDMKTIQLTLEQYYATTGAGSYPATVATAFSPQPVPSDPKPSPQPAYTTGNINTNIYCICATLEETTKGNATGVTATGCTWSATGNLYCVQNQQ
jgi:prepilin-type N-terminal cleavage/methylation domain-containing protein